MNVGSEISDETRQELSVLTKAKRDSVKLAAAPSDLLSKEGFALYIGKTPRGWLKWRKQESCQPFT